ncbi:hypothetical protein NDU88_000193 [Pleurodeles waltl]|uniref:Uncharacterized protein n=1 Tax=Pleurodeles waltl TaxID=8319 RepID=A0AAV7TGG3_PLEWA|nr:hypothetical protein NDU88_000193 [Pleurodeles waltl]
MQGDREGGQRRQGAGPEPRCKSCVCAPSRDARRPRRRPGAGPEPRCKSCVRARFAGRKETAKEVLIPKEDRLSWVEFTAFDVIAFP